MRKHMQDLLKDKSGDEGLLHGGQGPEDEDEEHHYVVAIIQNRAKEVGFACLELKGRSKLYLAQYVESTRSFTNTLTLLKVYKPNKLLLVASTNPHEGTLSETCLFLQDYSTRITPLNRGYFDDTEGMVLCQALSSPDSQANIEAGKGSYLSLGAAGALIKYMQQDQSMVLAGGSLEVCTLGSEHHMSIDAATIDALELVQPYAVGSSGRRGMTLFKLLDGTKTKSGAQLLRANLLQPLRDIPTLNARYEALEELQSNEELHMNLVACLDQLPKNIDGLCSALVLRPAKNEGSTLRRITAMIKSFIMLRDLLRLLPTLASALEPAECHIFTTLCSTCTAPMFPQLLERLEELIEDDAQASSNTFFNKTQCCFALKAGMDSLLDVARRNFSRLTEEVHQLADDLRTQHSVPHMKVQYAARRGFSFSIGPPPKSKKRSAAGAGVGAGDEEADEEEERMHREWEEEHLQYHQQQQQEHGAQPHTAQQRATGGGGHGKGRLPRLPPGFSLLSSNGRVFHTTTPELNALNARIQDASNECLVLTEQVLEGVSQDGMAEVWPVLSRLIDGLAVLDMVCGFATALALTGKEYVKPILADTGIIAIVEGRHPVLEAVEDSFFQPNDTFLSLNSSFHVITGPNMSGKSTYLRQAALTVIMAQVGCFVPAAFMSLAPVDGLFTRIGTGDSLETNTSSFMMEMQETAFILNNATHRSLVIIDELGRSTSTSDGIGIAWSISEHLITKGCRTLFATHFTQLNELASVYPNVRAWTMEVDSSRNRLDYSWKLKAGELEGGHYGLMLAKAVGFPDSILTQAQAVVQAVDAAEEQRSRALHTPQNREAEEVWNVIGNLACVSHAFKESGDERALQKQLRELQKEIVELEM